MSGLREDVRIITPGGELEGYLGVGADGLPMLYVDNNHPWLPSEYRPSSIPAEWRLLTKSPYQDVLYDAWIALTTLRTVIAAAQREAERETPEPEDDLTAAKRYQALEEE